MKHLVTGALGSGGSYMCEYLMGHGEVHGTGRWHTSPVIKEKPDYPIHECDLLDLPGICRVLETVKPDYIYHLASHANVRASFDNPSAVLRNNIDCTLNLLEAVRFVCPDSTVLLCSSSEVYGQAQGEVDESAPINPVSPYAVSKLTQDALGNAWFKSYGLKVIRVRAFTYLNPRRSDLFATSFAMQVARIEKGKQEILTHGNLDSTRTILDVRDTVRAYHLAATKGEPGEIYNVGGGNTMTVQGFLLSLIDRAKCEIPIQWDRSLARPADITMQIPDCRKFETLTGWKPEIPFDASIDHLLDHCRQVA